MIRFGLLVAVALLSAALPKPASAQYTPPGGPTLPIELDYFRPRQGVLDNYNQFIAPKHQLANQLRAMDQRQAADFKTLDRQIRDGDTLRRSEAAATGVAAGFMNYSHYYGMRAPAARPAARRPGR